MENLFKRNMADEIKKNLPKKKAFTLVEILIVVAVIGILFVALVPRIDFAGDKARETGVKTDFRSFELAAEQLIRENAGLADFADVDALCGANGINLYLDNALKFTDGECAKNDQWNQPYTVQIAKPVDAGNPNDGAIIFLSNGKDSLLNQDEDNYVLAVVFIDGQIESSTIGFSSNIEAGSIESIGASTTASMTEPADNKTAITYNKE